jgi:phenylalanyl-tRNA synthetase beta chain
LSAEEISGLLEKAGYGVEKVEESRVQVVVPCYRVDVMHQVDIIEDVAIAYDFNKIKPVWRKIPTTGGVRPEQGLIDVARMLMVGLGFQEVLNYTLTSPENLFKKMNCRRERVIEIANPKVNTLTCLRSWLLPSLMEFLSNNLHVECPQKIFELGKVTLIDDKMETRTRDEEKLASAVYDATAGFSEIKSCLGSLFMNFALKWRIEETRHPSFIDGRVGRVCVGNIDVGFLGEVHPKVLEAWALENPVAAFELSVDEIFRIKNVKR